MGRKKDLKEEVKEEKKEKKIVRLDDEKQKKLKSFSKAIYILARIFKVVTVIGVVCLTLAVIMVPVLVKNVEIKDNTISVFGEKIEYKEVEDGYKLSVKGEEFDDITPDEKIVLDYVVKELEKTNMTKVFLYAELGLVSSIAVLVLGYNALKHTEKLFININELPTPYTMDNLEHINRIRYLLLVIFIVSIASEMLSSLFFNQSVTNVSLSYVLIILVLYVISYIFEYACLLQNESKATIYDNID